MRGRRVDTGECVELVFAQNRLAAIVPIPSDPTHPWISPGWIDLQVNGYGGRAFNSPDLDLNMILAITQDLKQQGVCRYLPTCTTQSSALFEHSLATIADACRREPTALQAIAGIHLEGPYISPHDGPRGAHPQEHVRPPNWLEFTRWQQAAEGRIRLITLSPEYKESADFISQAVAAGVVVAIGHTSATSEQIATAVAAGATLSTHLGNGCHLQLKRHPNYLWDQLAEDRLSASLIADGHHLPPAVVKSFLRMKTPARCILVSDLTELAGCLPGRYRASLGDVELLSEGRLVLADQRDLLAGASQPLHVGIANAIRFASVSLPEAIQMVTANPAKLMHWPELGFSVGTAADDFVTFYHREHSLELVAPA